MCLLALLASEPAHGYELVRRVEATGFDAVGYGTVYPLLTRMRRLGLVGGALGTTAGLGALLLLYRLLGSSPSEPTPARLFSTVPLGGTCRAAPPTRIEVYQ